MVLIKDLVADHPGEVIRAALLSAHYRQPLDWSDRLIEATQQRLDRLYRTLLEAGIEYAGDESEDLQSDKLVAPLIAALEDDLNTPQALSELAALARETNRCDDKQRRRELGEALRRGGSYLGLLGASPAAWLGASSDSRDDVQIDELIQERDRLRQAGDYQAADRIRDDLAARGIIIEDGADGVRWYRAR